MFYLLFLLLLLSVLAAKKWDSHFYGLIYSPQAETMLIRGSCPIATDAFIAVVKVLTLSSLNR
jgi:hypothetical protein